MLQAFRDAEAAIAPVMDSLQISEDPQYLSRPSIVTVEDDELGPIKMQNVFPFLSRTPGTIRISATLVTIVTSRPQTGETTAVGKVGGPGFT